MKKQNDLTPDFAFLLFNLYITMFTCAADVFQIQTKVASIFVTTHQSVAQVSQQMKLELKRHNYVTPTNYLELVSGYKK